MASMVYLPTHYRRRHRPYYFSPAAFGVSEKFAQSKWNHGDGGDDLPELPFGRKCGFLFSEHRFVASQQASVQVRPAVL